MKKISLTVTALVFALTCAIAGAATLDDVINNAAREICKDLPKRARVAIVNFNSEDDKVSDYIMEELTYAFVENDVEVADRTNLPWVRQQLQLQAQGEVSDKDEQQIGKFIGARAIISGDFIPTGGQYRFRVTAVGVETAARLSGARYDVSEDGALRRTLAALKGGQMVSRPNQGASQKAKSAVKTAGNWLDEGIKLTSQSRFTEAVEAFTQALRLDSGLSAAYALRGNALYASASYVISVSENFSSISMMDIVGIVASDERKAVYDRAIADYTQALRLDPNIALAYNNRGMAYAGKGDYDRAIADYTQALRLDPNIALAHNNRGMAYADKGDYDWAIADYTQALRIDPDLVAVYNNRGMAYAGKRDYDRAIADYTQALRLDPNDADVYNKRGIAYYYKGDLNKAIGDYNEALRLDPNNAAAYYNRGDAYFNRGDNDRAIADFTQVLRLDPNNAVAYNNRGYAYSGKGDNNRAIADFTQALRLDSNNAAAYFNRGDAYYYKRDYDRAIADYTQAIRLNPSYAATYYNRGVAYRGKGDQDRAIADYTQAIRLDPNYAAAYNDRGAAYARKKDYDRAIADFTQALRLDSNNANTRHNLETARQAQRAARACAPCDSGADCTACNGSACYIQRWVQVTPWNGYWQGSWVPCNSVGCTHCGTR
jgi:tetratricopeptide (TPR) repeat protein